MEGLGLPGGLSRVSIGGVRVGMMQEAFVPFKCDHEHHSVN